MAHGNNNVTTTSVAAELGITPIRKVSLLAKYASQNENAFFKGIGLIPNATTNLPELYDFGSDYKLGDFRSYNNASSAPSGLEGVIHKWGPGGTLTDLVNVPIFPQLLNVKESEYYSSATTDYYTVDLYTSSSDRAAKTNRTKRFLFAITFENITIPVNHTLDDIGITQRAQSPQLVTLDDVDTSKIGRAHV